MKNKSFTQSAAGLGKYTLVYSSAGQSQVRIAESEIDIILGLAEEMRADVVGNMIAMLQDMERQKRKEEENSL